MEGGVERMKTIKYLRLSLALLALMSACAPRLLNPISQLIGSLPFRTDPQNKDVSIYQNPTRRVTAYSQFMVDRVKIYGNEFQRIKPEDQLILATNFRNELVAALQGAYRIVNDPGPGVLRIRTAILDFQPSHLEFDEDKFLVIRMDTLLTRVQMELDCVDAVTGERIAALIYRLRDPEHTKPETVRRMISAKDAFGIWARSLRTRFDAAKKRDEGAFEGIDPQEERRLRFEEGE